MRECILQYPGQTLNFTNIEINPFQGLESQYQWEKCFANACNCIQPEEVYLGERAIRTKSGVRKTRCYAYVIPFQRSFQVYLKCLRYGNVWILPTNDLDMSCMIYVMVYTYRDTLCFRGILYFRSSDHLVYRRNWVGAHVKNYKVTMFYFTYLLSLGESCAVFTFLEWQII